MSHDARRETASATPTILGEALVHGQEVGVEADAEVVSGDEVRSIVAVADEIEADLIVLGAGRKRPKLPSVTRAVVTTAHCPIYVAHAA